MRKRNCPCVYKNIWEAAVGETLSCVRESRNAHDRYAVAVEKNSTVVEHLPRKDSHVCAVLLTCIVEYCSVAVCNAVEPSSSIHMDTMMYKIHSLTDIHVHVSLTDIHVHVSLTDIHVHVRDRV